MHVSVDDAVIAEFPDLIRTVTGLHLHWSLAPFDSRLGPAHLRDTFTTRPPEVLVVDSKWLVIGAPILMSLLRHTDSDAAKTLITVPRLDNVAKVRATLNGFTDMVHNGESSDDLVEKIENVRNGQSLLHEDSLWQTVRKPTPVNMNVPIAENGIDRDIIELIRIGIPDNEIAECLFLSSQTVRNRVSAMLQRDGFTNRTQLAWAYSNQVVVERFVQNPLWLS